MIKSGQISYIIIRAYVKPKSESCTVNKQMLIRDGIPTFGKDDKSARTDGCVIEFIKGQEEA